MTTRCAIVCFVLILNSAICGHAQTNPPKELTSTISGKVTVQGNTVAGVVITLRSTERGSNGQLLDQRGVTNARGEYRITNVPAGNYTVAPVAAAFVVVAGETERSVIVGKGETIEDLDFSLLPGGVITGKVVDPDGVPLIEEEVHIFPERNEHAYSGGPAAITDDRGVYRIFGLKPGGYRIAAGRDNDEGGRRPSGVHARTYYPGIADFAQAAVIQVSEGTETANVNITLSRMLTTHTASGRIVDGETGQPVANVKYGYRRFDRYNGVNRGNLGATNERGEFKLAGLVPGQYALVVSADPGSYVRVEEVQFQIVDQDVNGLVVKTLKDASLSGVVVLEGAHDKDVIEEFRKLRLVAFVETEASQKGGTLGVEATMEPNGNFRIAGLPAGKATFMFGPPKFFITRVERNGINQLFGFELKQAERVTGLRIVVAYGNASLRGTIEVENGPLPPNARLAVWARPVNEEYTHLPTPKIDARGQFVFDAIVPGTYEISAGIFVTGSGPRIYKRQQVIVIPGAPNNITITIDLKVPQSRP